MATVDNIFVKTMKLIKKVFFSQTVLCIAILAMLVSCIFVPIDSEYAGYFNFQTLATLFCTLAVVGAFSDIHLFEIISKSIIIKLKNLRYAVITLVFITFFGSMILANDMALLTFLPLGFFVLDRTDNYDSMAFTFIMQNIAANLGGMLTPFGNPQNLYLFAFYEIDNIEFMQIMFPTFAAATVMIIIICLFVKKTPLELKRDDNYKFNVKRTVIYSCLFVFSILIVFRVVNPFVGTFVVVAALMFLDRKALKIVNYPLLLTFCCFFVFSSNLARIQAVNDFFQEVLPLNTLLFGILSCQCISNVPSAVLLSHFTNDYRALLQAVNIGGCGTLIASLASLITFTEFKKHNPGKVGNYLAKFTAFNLLFIVVLYFVATAFM
ncbi:MAG: citrate transporter [Lachnospiraceae bacterium]|nr:citrate transporter [Lachnospiraceae bacterium]